MRKEFWRHPRAYLILTVGLVALTVLFLAAWPHLWWQRGAIMAIGIFYFGWGVVTHLQADHISKRVVFEYFGISLLATVILLVTTV